MNTPSEYPDFAQEHLLRLQSKTRTVLTAVDELIQSGAVKDEADREMIKKAIALIENPTEDIATIQGTTTMIGMVCGGYEMLGTDVPAAVDDMHKYLLALQCINRISFVEAELEMGSPDNGKIEQAMVWALDAATHLSRGYKDSSLLEAVNELQERLGSL
jgi:hypothetical protein